MATLTKNKKWNLRLKFCETDSKVSTPVSRRDNNNNYNNYGLIYLLISPQIIAMDLANLVFNSTD